MNYFNLYTPLNDLGYGVVGRGLIRGLHQLGQREFHLNPIGPMELHDLREKTIIDAQLSFSWQRNCPSLAIWHEFDLSRFSGKKLVALPIFEADSFTPIAKHYLSQMDAVFVLSTWAKEVVERNLGYSVPVIVVPGASDDVPTPTFKKNDSFTFLNVGKLEVRKSQAELIQAYLQAFETRKEETRLLLHCFNPFLKDFEKVVMNLLTSLGLQLVQSTSSNSIIATKGNCIVQVPVARLSREQVFNLYQFAHVGVFPTKAEGWNLPLMEAIKSGLPSIATDYSAQRDYLSPALGYPQELLLKDFTLVPSVDGIWFKGDRGNWAAVKVEEIAQKMTLAFDTYSTIHRSFSNDLIKSQFTWQNSAEQLTRALDSL